MLKDILDIHTHHPAPQPFGIVAATPENFKPIEGQLYSVGIHPWDTDRPAEPELLQKLEVCIAHPSVVAIGETGVDTLKGGPMFRQLQIFKKHIELSEKYGKPLVIHDVKAHDIIIGVKKDFNPTQKWLVHGFRAKPTVATMLLDAGISLSFGEKFNPDSLKICPQEMLFAETDESPESIIEIIHHLSEARGEDLMHIIQANTRTFLFDNKQESLSEKTKKEK